jgi:signal transduction histidine kinase
VPYYDEKGNVIGTIGITRNITDKMIAEEELRRHKDQLEELVRERTHELEESREKLLKMYTVKSEFTSMVSHELRTPLAIIKEAVSIVEDEIEGPLGPKQKEYLHIASQNIERLARLINDILDFSKLEGKKMEFKIVEGDLNGLIRQVLKSYEGIIEKKGLGLRANLDPSLPLVGLDEDRIVQVLHNLFDNAIKFTERGWIAVGSRTVGNGLEVSVEDTGCGIRGEDLHRVFEKFEQLVPEGQKKKNGTGLGLAICKQIIEQLGGRIFVESEYGKGSKFFFTLPTRGARANEGER